MQPPTLKHIRTHTHWTLQGNERYLDQTNLEFILCVGRYLADVKDGRGHAVRKPPPRRARRFLYSSDMVMRKLSHHIIKNNQKKGRNCRHSEDFSKTDSHCFSFQVPTEAARQVTPRSGSWVVSTGITNIWTVYIVVNSKPQNNKDCFLNISSTMNLT